MSEEKKPSYLIIVSWNFCLDNFFFLVFAEEATAETIKLIWFKAINELPLEWLENKPQKKSLSPAPVIESSSSACWKLGTTLNQWRFFTCFCFVNGILCFYDAFTWLMHRYFYRCKNKKRNGTYYANKLQVRRSLFRLIASLFLFDSICFSFSFSMLFKITNNLFNWNGNTGLKTSLSFSLWHLLWYDSSKQPLKINATTHWLTSNNHKIKMFFFFLFLPSSTIDDVRYANIYTKWAHISTYIYLFIYIDSSSALEDLCVHVATKMI